MQQRRLKLLQNMPVFGGVSSEALDFVMADAPIARRGPGEHFFRDGDDGVAVFVLERGQVAVTRTWRGHECEFARLGVGDCFGEMSLIDFEPRSASVRAVEQCAAIELSAARIHSLYEFDLKQFTLVQMNLARELSRRIRHTDELLLAATADPAQVAWLYVST